MSNHRNDGSTGDPKQSEQKGRQLTRREILQWAAAAGVTFSAGGLLQACGGSQTPTTSKGETPAASTTPAARKKGGTIRIALYGETTIHDPFGKATNPPANDIRRQCIDTLFTLSENFEVIPELCDSYTISPDGKTYIFKLRQGAMCHNGQELTSEDVAYSLQRIRDDSARKTDYKSLKTINIIDRYTLEIITPTVDPALLPALAMFFAPIVNKAAGEADVKANGYISKPIGTGPFEYVSYTPNRETKVKRFEGYKPRPEPTNGLGGQKTAWADELVFIDMADAEVRNLALESGQIDYVQQVAPKDVERLKKNKNITVTVTPGTDWGVMWFNFKYPPFDKLEARKAIVSAINFEELTKAVFWGYGTANNSLIPPTQANWRTPEHERLHKYDPELAKTLLKQVGYNGEELKWMTGNDERSEKTAQVLQEQMRKVGVNLKIEVMESAVMSDLRYARRLGKDPIWPFTATTSSSFRPDPAQHYGIRARSDQHPGMYNNPAYDKIIDEAASITDFARRKELYSQAQKILMDDIPLVVIYDAPFIDAYNNRLEGVVVKDGFSPFFWNVSVKS